MTTATHSSRDDRLGHAPTVILDHADAASVQLPVRLPDDVLMLVADFLTGPKELIACAMSGNRAMTEVALRKLYEQPLITSNRALDHFLTSYEALPTNSRVSDLPVYALDLSRVCTEVPMTPRRLEQILSLVRPTLRELKLGRGEGGGMFDPGAVVDMADWKGENGDVNTVLEASSTVLERGEAGNPADDWVQISARRPSDPLALPSTPSPPPQDLYLTSLDLGRATYFTKPAFLRRLAAHPHLSRTLRHLRISLFPSSYFVSDVPPTFFHTILGSFPNLESLHIHSTNALDDPFLFAVADHLPNLRALGVTYTRGFTQPAIAALLTAKGPQLASLQAQDVPAFWRPDVLSLIATTCKMLERLDLGAPRSIGERFGANAGFAAVKLPPLEEWAIAPRINQTGLTSMDNETTLSPETPALIDHLPTASPPTSIFQLPHLTHLLLDYQTSTTDVSVRLIVSSLPLLRSLGLGRCRHLTVASLDAIVGCDGGHRLKWLRELKFDAVGVEGRHLWRWGGGAGSRRGSVDGGGSVGHHSEPPALLKDATSTSDDHATDTVVNSEPRHNQHRHSHPSSRRPSLTGTHPSPTHPAPLTALSLSFRLVSDLALLDFFHRVRYTLRCVGSLHGFRREAPDSASTFYGEVSAMGVEWSQVPLVWDLGGLGMNVE